jgi:hypothetical protein
LPLSPRSPFTPVAGTSDGLFAYRMHDGALVSSLPGHCVFLYLAVDAAASTLYFCDAVNSISSARWDAASSTFVLDGRVPSIDAGQSFRPLTVVPPAHGKSTSHLVVGTCYSPVLRIYSLPDHVLVHTHTLAGKGMRVEGLAADPCGTALVVCDGHSSNVLILAWPLPGMPALA